MERAQLLRMLADPILVGIQPGTDAAKLLGEARRALADEAALAAINNESLRRLHDAAHDIAGNEFLNWRSRLREACAEVRADSLRVDPPLLATLYKLATIVRAIEARGGTDWHSDGLFKLATTEERTEILDLLRRIRPVFLP